MNTYTESIETLRTVIQSTGNSSNLRPFSNTTDLKVSVGNTKIGTDTLILNMGTAHNCPSAKLGLCSLAHSKHGGDGSCYALKAEYIYPSPIPFRSIQKIQFDHWDEFKIAFELFKVIYRKAKHNRIKFVRFNEAGDFHSIEQVIKAGKIARLERDMRVDGKKVNQFTCLDDCRKCSLCKVRPSKGITIIQAKH